MFKCILKNGVVVNIVEVDDDTIVCKHEDAIPTVKEKYRVVKSGKNEKGEAGFHIHEKERDVISPDAKKMWHAPEGCEVGPEGGHIGWLFDGTKYINPNPTPPEKK